MNLKLPVTVILLILLVSAQARVGETEQELMHRYGTLKVREPARLTSQGRVYTYGEYLHFSADDWNINALVINGQCEEVTYSKMGEWTEEQFKHLLELNGGRSQWEEQKTGMPTVRREWKRRDKVMATWIGASLEIKTPVVEQTREAVRKTAKEEASKLPKF